MESLKGFKRTSNCGTVHAGDIGSEISVCGWVQRQRDLGQLIFIDLRDRTGILSWRLTIIRIARSLKRRFPSVQNLFWPPRGYYASGHPRTRIFPRVRSNWK